MDERGNQTVMCSVLFLDIEEYSKQPVTGQISLKDRFNSSISSAIRDVPIADRIILDTGDGVAINFLGDVEDALKSALTLRENLLNEDPEAEYSLRVRMGINLGPVRIVRDINGHPNIVGDGINVAQRVMGFADVSQILVSRSYYDAVSRLSPHYAGMFHYQGSRTDKHVREHEVYAIGYPGDSTMPRGTSKQAPDGQAAGPLSRAMEIFKSAWRYAAAKLDALFEHIATGFRHAEPQQRVVYAGAIAIPVLLLTMLIVELIYRGEVPASPDRSDKQAIVESQPASAVEPVAPVRAADRGKTKIDSKLQASTVPKRTVVSNREARQKSRNPQSQSKSSAQEPVTKNASSTASGGNSNAFISVSCREGTEVFVDGVRKGRISSFPLTIAIPPGKHTVIVSHPKAGVSSQDIAIEARKVVRLNPGFCNK